MKLLSPVALLLLCSCSSPPENSESTKTTSPTEQKLQDFSKQSALLASRKFVEKDIKYPASAEWSEEYEKAVKQENDSTYYVVSNVTCPNAFGVKARAIYTATIVYHPNKDSVTCNDAYLMPFD